MTAAAQLVKVCLNYNLIVVLIGNACGFLSFLFFFFLGVFFFTVLICCALLAACFIGAWWKESHSCV